jgi:hypothetical protein
MSKTLWHTIKLEVPKEMVNITKNDKVVVKKSLTKTNNISKANKEPYIKIIPGDTNKPKIISDGKEWNIEELKLKMKKAKELGKKNEGKELKKPSVKQERVKKYVEDFKDRKEGYIKERKRSKEDFDEDKEKFNITDTYTNVNDLIKENESKLKKLFIEHVKNHKYVDAYDLNNVKLSEYRGDRNKLSSGKYATYPRYNTKDSITYVKHIGYTPSFQEFYKMEMDTINHFIYNTQHQN